MIRDYNTYWEKCWKEDSATDLYRYLDMYNGIHTEEIEIFKQNNIESVCDAACGFGAYSLAFATNGFKVHGFDISETAVAITKEGLAKYKYDTANFKVASILDTGYADEAFGGVIAHAVLDHLTMEDAQKALKELHRITKTNGMIWISFDVAEAEDFEEEHITYDDGTMEYTDGSREGMLFNPFEEDKIDELLRNYHIVHRVVKGNREVSVILKK